MGTIYNTFKLAEETSKKQFSEMSTLINMAEAMQLDLLAKKREIRKNILIISFFAYLSIIVVIGFKVITPTVNGGGYFMQALIATFSFFFGASIFCFYRIRIVIEEIKIERSAMQELMEIIFNLRKVLPKENVDVVDLTIIDLKLKRLRFY